MKRKLTTVICILILLLAVFMSLAENNIKIRGQLDIIKDKTPENHGLLSLCIDGEIIYVDDDNTDGPWDGTWSHPYQYIQDGVDNANAGDTITYTITDINLCTNSAIDSITVTEFTGIINQSDQSAVNIYPNPNNGNFKIKFNLQQNDIVSLKVYNALNAVVFEENSISVGQTFAKDLELNDLTKGVYYLHIDGKKTNIIKKLVIQ